MTMNISTSDLRWLAPVFVRIGYGMPETIRSPEQALDFLRHRWPNDRGPFSKAAEQICSEEPNCRHTIVEAREAFISACIEAGVLD